MKKITNKLGFTLIELLAVIVILAIIALIATPIVMNIISDTKISAAERSAENYIKQINTKAASLYANPATRLVDGAYNIMSNGNLCFGTLSNEGASCVESSTITIEMSGTKPTSGIVVIENGKVVSRLVIDSNIRVTNFTTNEYTFTFVENRKIGIVPQKICTLTNGEPLAIGSKYECEVGEGIIQTFYVLEDGDSETKTAATEAGEVSLIMDSNINIDGVAVKSDEITNKGLVAWSSDGSNHKDDPEEMQAIVAKVRLNEATISWINIDKVSLPTGQQIANIVNNTTWTDRGVYISLSSAPWLYDYLRGTESPISGVYGYWTLSPYLNNSSNAWSVRSDGKLNDGNISNDNIYGIRPVITINKSELQ